MISESTRQAVLDRDNWQCQQCGAQLERGIGRHHLHHLSYVDDEPDHLTSMCPSCHKKTDHTEMGASEHYGDKTVVTVSRSTLNKVIELSDILVCGWLVISRDCVGLFCHNNPAGGGIHRRWASRRRYPHSSRCDSSGPVRFGAC